MGRLLRRGVNLTFLVQAAALRQRSMSSLSARAKSETVEAMEVLVAMSPEDYARAFGAGGLGFAYAGSFAGRNIEKIYEWGGLRGSLEAAVRGALGGATRHALVAGGFYVLHGLGGHDGRAPGVAAGSCETDGPLGALAVLRAFAARGTMVSLYAEAHNGPVLAAGYDAMLRAGKG